MQNPSKMHTYLVSSGKPIHRMAEGIGCNMLITNQGRLPDPQDRKGWRVVFDTLDDMQMGWMRVGIIPGRSEWEKRMAWSDVTQQWDFNHRHWQVFLKIAKWARERGVRLMYDPFSVPKCFRREGKFFADNPRLYAEKLILPVVKFFHKHKLENMRYIGLFNEAIWGEGKQGFAAAGEFFEMFKAVREVLDDNGFGPEKLGLMGPSALNTWEWPVSDFFALGLDPDQYWSAYDQHFYLYHFDWIHDNRKEFVTLSELTERYIRRFVDYTHKRGKPFFITEMGNFFCGRLFWGERDYDGPMSHTSLLMDAELIIRSINEGADGFLRWAFCVDGNRDGRWGFLEQTESGFDRRPPYDLYRLLMRAVRPGATILETHSDVAIGGFRHVFSAAVKNVDGSASLLLINDYPGRNVDIGLELGAPFKGKKLIRTVWDETRKGSVLEPIKINAKGEGTAMLTPYSVTVLSTKDLG